MRISYAITTLFGALATTSPLTQRGVTVGFDWGSEKVRGVNIGGWLVLEPWITPSIFQSLTSQGHGYSIVDEWTLGQNVPNDAPDILQKHWDSWVGLADFQKIAANGFNTVRIPIGYWAYQKFDDPYVTGSAQYLDRAIDWARQTGLKVWIDLHTAPGSQNGFDNSGRKGDVGWGKGNTVKDTLTVIQTIANKYAQGSYQDVVVAIELLNEPLASSIQGDGVGTVIQFYKDGFGNVRTVSDTPVVIHDAFVNASTFDGTLSWPGQDVVIDHHEYQVFTEDLLNKSPQDHIHTVCSNADSYAKDVDHWVVVGEWTGAMTDCAAALNGYGVGSRWEGTYPGSSHSSRSCGDINFIETWDQTQKTNTQNFINAQLDVYEQRTQGYIFWNFKTEASAEWDLFRLLDAGVFPNLKNRKVGSPCS